MNLSHLARGAATANRMGRRLAKTGMTTSGQLLWTEKEIEALKRLYRFIGYAKSPGATGQSYWAIRHRAQKLGLTKKRHVWTGADIIKLRRVYAHGTPAEAQAAFPDVNMSRIRKTAQRNGIFRPKKPFKATGIPIVDQIRARAFELGYSMSEIDEMARSKRYFQAAGWVSGHLHHRAIARAILALDGVVAANWREELGTELPRLLRPASSEALRCLRRGCSGGQMRIELALDFQMISYGD